MASVRFAMGRPDTVVPGGGDNGIVGGQRCLMLAFHVIALMSSSTSTPLKLVLYAQTPAASSSSAATPKTRRERASNAGNSREDRAGTTRLWPCNQYAT